MPSRAFQQASIISSDGALTGVTVTPSQISDQANTSTGYIDLPSGTTAQRPVSTTSGSVRYNTTLATVEVYNGTSWLPVGTVYDAESSSTGFFDLPSGTTAERPATPTVGMMRYNSTTGFAEVYTSAGWGIFGALPPSISSVSPVTFNGEQGTSFTINGSNFTNDATVRFITNSGVEYTAGSVSFVNSGQLVATTSRDFLVSEEPLDVKVLQASGTTTAIDIIDCGGSPAWSTTAGSVYATNIYENELLISNRQLVATDPDAASTITYSVASGTLPSGIILSSTGVLTGTAPTLASDTTYNFTARASDNAQNTSDRAFSISILNDPSLDYISNLKLWIRGGYNGATVGVIAAGTDTLAVPIKGTTSGTINTIGTVSRIQSSLTASPVDGTKFIKDSAGGSTAALQDDKLALGLDSGDSFWVALSTVNPILDSSTTNHTFAYWMFWENRSENTSSNLFCPTFHSWQNPSFIAHDWYTNSTNNIYVMHYANGALQGTFTTPNISGGINGNKGVWFHFAVVNTSSSTKFYVNGTESTGHSVSAVTSWPAITSTSTINFHGRGDGTSGGLPGNYTSGYSGFKSLADIRYYNAALSSSAIAAIYSKSRSNFS